ncbi:MAG: M23 family metallopeptidase [Lachnospiraceae bacterium]|nr:M23 family metallopeptidase [Lachnospiraceae bacterium]MBQ7777087.1 M23 family metallopeptidase [Lachnospiraceae bacterium]
MRKKGYLWWMRGLIVAEGVFLLVLMLVWNITHSREQENYLYTSKAVDEQEKIKWVDFDVSYEALCLAYEWDVKTCEEEIHLNWIELLAYLGTKYGGDFDSYSKSLKKDMNALAEKLTGGEYTMEELTEGMKYYDYYLEAYGAVLSGMVGEYERQTETGWEKCYGLKVYFPLAKGFEYTHYDDFGAGRSYGYDRKHLGHDMMGATGVPVIAVESGVVEAIGWNQYGGWRIGIRSFDEKRYYYYAHLRQNYPYAEGLEEGSIVTAGDVIGYMGRTGYSAEENVNNIDVTHLHWGLELIFDEERREQGYEVWIDVYALTQFLHKNRCETYKVEGTKEWKRVWDMKEQAVEEFY